MQAILLIVLLVVTLAMICVILLQRSEGGGLSGGNQMAGILSARGSKTFLTRFTSILATLFLVLCLALAVLAKKPKEALSIADEAAKAAAGQPATPQASPAEKPAEAPAVPLAQ
jgi:preprotein translocase subunit SecG